MADLSILAGATSQSILVDLYVLSTGAGQTGLVFNSSGLTAYYSFAGASATATAITLATLAAVNSAYSSGGFKELDATNMPGVYRFDVPNAVIAAAKGREVIITFNGFSGMAARHIKVELTAVDNQSTAFGLSLAKTTNITGFNDIAATAVVSSGAITTSAGKVSGVALVDTLTTYTGNTVQTGDSYARIGATGSGLTSLAASSTALSSATWTGTLATNLTTLASHDPGATIGTSTLTQTQVTGGAYNVQSASCVLGDARVAHLDADVSSRLAPAGTLATVTNLTNAPTSGDFTAAMKTSLNAATPASVVGAVGSVTGAVGSIATGGIVAGSIASSALNGKGDWNIGKTGYALSAAGVQAIWDALTSALTTVGSVGKLLVDNINATVSSRLSSGSYTAPDNTSIAAIKAKTDNLPATPAATGDAMALTSGERTAVANVITSTAMTESYAAKNGTMTIAQALYEIAQLMGEQGITGTTLTIKKRDQTTIAKTFTLDSSTAPTSITEAS